MPEVTHKLCKTCGELKPLGYFAKGRGGKHGCVAHCKLCMSARAKAVAIKNKKDHAFVIPDKKVCSKCEEEKSAAQFAKDMRATDGLQPSCRACNYDRQLNRLDTETDEERELRLAAHRRASARYTARQNIRARTGELVANGPECRFIRGALKRILVLTKQSKIDHAEKMLGYTRAELRARLEMNFKKGMSWANTGAWHIDHTIPVSHFLRKGEIRPHIINALCNLRPMWASENFSKGAKHPFLERKQHA